MNEPAEYAGVTTTPLDATVRDGINAMAGIHPASEPLPARLLAAEVLAHVEASAVGYVVVATPKDDGRRYLLPTLHVRLPFAQQDAKWLNEKHPERTYSVVALVPLPVLDATTEEAP